MSESDDLIQKATDTLTSAKILFEADRPTDCVSRSYYAMYQATQALLVAHDLESNSHKGARMLLGKHFVKPNELDSRFAVALRQAYDARVLADYSGDSVSKKQAQQILSDADTFVAEMKKRLDQK
jgi:uncharacterized protein (UPF0332 family)